MVALADKSKFTDGQKGATGLVVTIIAEGVGLTEIETVDEPLKTSVLLASFTVFNVNVLDTVGETVSLTSG